MKLGNYCRQKAESTIYFLNRFVKRAFTIDIIQEYYQMSVASLIASFKIMFFTGCRLQLCTSLWAGGRKRARQWRKKL